MSELWHESTWTAEGHRYQQQITRVPIVTPRPLPVFGVQVHALWSVYWGSGTHLLPLLEQHLDLLKSHHVKLIRVDYGWSAGQPTNASLDAKWYYNARFKAVLDLAGQLGLEVLVTIHQSPNWARPGTGDNVKQFPTDLAAWGRFCDEFDMMFGNHPALFAVECWNEPNLQEFTGISDPLQRAQKYAPVLQTALGNIFTNVMFGGPSQCDDAFVKDVLAATPADLDAWSVHPYMADQTIPPDDTSNATSKGRVAHYPAVRDVFRARSNAQIWWSEFGFSVHANTGSEPMWKKGVPTEEASADYLIRQMRLAVEWGVAGVVVYCAYRNSGDVHVQGFSLIHDDGSPTKQLTALGEFFGGQA